VAAPADNFDPLVKFLDGDAQTLDIGLALLGLGSRNRVRRRMTSLRCSM